MRSPLLAWALLALADAGVGVIRKSKKAYSTTESETHHETLSRTFLWHCFHCLYEYHITLHCFHEDPLLFNTWLIYTLSVDQLVVGLILFTGRCEYAKVEKTLSSGAALGGLMFRTMGGAMDACDAGPSFWYNEYTFRYLQFSLCKMNLLVH